ncbi:MAG: hypothetical protein BMS9Abin12_0463 [Acidimicrobiia bacterium]|nr:MAG: hypothetical protein BMS9Abin12_0463 [Acidimicrobiia bacterium]
MARSPFLLNVSDLLGNDASSRKVTVTESVRWKIEMIRVAEEPPLTADLVLHPVSGGIAVTGRARFTTVDTCYRCLTETLTDRDTSVGALFESGNDDDETYPLEGHDIDVSQMLRDEVLLSLPIIEDCGDGCSGIVSSAQSDLNTELSGDDEARSPFAVLKDLLEPEG